MPHYCILSNPTLEEKLKAFFLNSSLMIKANSPQVLYKSTTITNMNK